MWILASGTTDPASGASLAGMAWGIKQITVDHRAKVARVDYAIWLSKAARDAGAAPVVDRNYYFEYNDASPVAGGQYTPVFGSVALTATPSPTTAAAYAAAPNNPQIAAMLAGATVG